MWLLTDFLGEGPFHTERGGEPVRKRDGTTVATFTSPTGTQIPMCEPCNGRLDQVIEKTGKPVVRAVMPKSSDHGWPTLAPLDAAALGRWLLKVALLLSHPAAVDVNPHVAGSREGRAIEPYPDEWLDWLRDPARPPNGFSVFMTKRSPQSETSFEGDRTRLVLPAHLHVAGRDMRFVSRSIGFRGVDAAIVWHPGWPIVHPLVEAGRAARLWPDPEPIELADLPEVHSREFGFVTGGGSMVCTESEFELLTRAPLRVDKPPTTIWTEQLIERR